MPSIKAMNYEKALLAHSGELKEMVLKHLSEQSDVKQDFLIAINNFFETSHTEGRRLRKALAFLHGANDAFKAQLLAHGIVPDENYGKVASGQSTRT